MGVAPLARASAMNFFNTSRSCDTSCCLVSWLSISCVLAPMPLMSRGAEIVVDRSFVVVAELHHHKVALLQHREDSVPVPLTR